MGVAKFKWYAALRAKGKMAPIETDYDEPEEENLEEEKFILLSELINKLDDICREILTQKYWLKKKLPLSLSKYSNKSLRFKLNKLGWCYGKYNQAGFEMSWHQCEANSIR